MDKTSYRFHMLMNWQITWREWSLSPKAQLLNSASQAQHIFLFMSTQFVGTKAEIAHILTLSTLLSTPSASDL